MVPAREGMWDALLPAFGSRNWEGKYIKSTSRLLFEALKKTPARRADILFVPETRIVRADWRIELTEDLER